MLTKAYITAVISPHKVRVRMPIFNKIGGVNGATQDNELAFACVCTLPNFMTSPSVGDVVIVGFEEDNLGSPVVLGYLSVDKEVKSTVDITCDKLTANDEVILDEHTTIGKVSPDNIKCLTGLKQNLKDFINATDTRIDELQKKVIELEQSAQSNAKTISENSLNNAKLFESINHSINIMAADISSLKDSCASLDTKFNDYLKKYPTVFSRDSYGTGTSNIDNPTEGQIYFTLKGDN